MSDIPTLYIVPTPIGNLADITQRALDILRSVDLVAAEDTRHTGILLSHYQISVPTFALHDHNEQQKADVLIARIKEGKAPLFNSHMWDGSAVPIRENLEIAQDLLKRTAAATRPHKGARDRRSR